MKNLLADLVSIFISSGVKALRSQLEVVSDSVALRFVLIGHDLLVVGEGA